jgi:hypothetical protein
LSTIAFLNLRFQLNKDSNMPKMDPAFRRRDLGADS